MPSPSPPAKPGGFDGPGAEADGAVGGLRKVCQFDVSFVATCENDAVAKEVCSFFDAPAVVLSEGNEGDVLTEECPLLPPSSSSASAIRTEKLLLATLGLVSLSRETVIS